MKRGQCFYNILLFSRKVVSPEACDWNDATGILLERVEESSHRKASRIISFLLLARFSLCIQPLLFMLPTPPLISPTFYKKVLNQEGQQKNQYKFRAKLRCWFFPQRISLRNRPLIRTQVLNMKSYDGELS